MDYKAALMVLVLVSGSLAGCTGDPDGGGGDEIDSDALQDLFDEHFQDFLNNTTITVINNYHNNTTYVVDDGDYSSTTNVEYNNTTINEGDETSTSNYNNQTDNDYSSSSLNYSLNGSGGGSGSVVQSFRVVWNLNDAYEPTNFGARDVVIDGVVQIPGWSGSEMSYQYNGNLIKFDFTCEEFVNAYHQMQYQDWEDWLLGEYGGSTGQANDLGYDIAQDIYQIENNADGDFCWENSNPPMETNHNYIDTYDREDHYATVVEIPLSAGQAIDFMSIPYFHNITLDCDDGFSSSSGNGTQYGYTLLGGHDDCIVRANVEIESSYTYLGTSVANGSGPSIQTPEWFNGGQWYVFTILDEEYHNVMSSDYPQTPTPTDFLIYFTMHFVQVYEHDLE
jgi:hypothetical protein